MARHLRTATILLVLGAVTNVAVAWGCALLGTPQYRKITASRAADQAWARAHVADRHNGCIVIDGRSAGTRRQALYEFTALQAGWREEQQQAFDSVRRAEAALVRLHTLFGPGPHPSVIRDQFDTIWRPADVERVSAGWPCKSLEYLLVRRPRGFGGHCGNGIWAELVEQHGRHDLRLVWGRWTIEGEIPIRPIGSGFAANTCFNATALWLLLPGPFVLRRYIRLKRRLCPKCAYPIGESDVCTECGSVVQDACPDSRT